jgi:glutamate-1-semialdehyde 2,1-aminomutase
MTAMDAFLTRLEDPAFRSIYHGLDDIWNGRAQRLNERLAEQDLPVRVSNLSSIWMVQYTVPSRYNWMFQYYLRAEQLALSWIGTGRLIFSLNYTDADFADVADSFVAAAGKMKHDGWWWHDGSVTNKGIRRRILKEMITRKRPR